MSRVPAISANVLDFLHASRLRAENGQGFTVPSTPGAESPVDRQAAAKVIAMPRRAVAPAVETPSVEVLAKVTKSVDTLFPSLRGSMRQEMIATIGEIVAEDPHVRQLMA